MAAHTFGITGLYADIDSAECPLSSEYGVRQADEMYITFITATSLGVLLAKVKDIAGRH